MSHSVVAGDSLWKIAQQNGTTVAALKKANPQIENINLIRVGETINLPGDTPEAAPANAPLVDAILAGDNLAYAVLGFDPTLDGLEVYEICAPCNLPAVNPLGVEWVVPAEDPHPEDSTKFGVWFEEITNMKLSQSIKLYEDDTNNVLTPETVEILFTDPDAAKKLLISDVTLHTNYRSILNNSIPRTEQEAIDAEYKKKYAFESEFHNPDDNFKYVGPNGYLEAVYNKESGNLDPTEEFEGTFNFFPAGPISYFTEHGPADIDTWEHWDRDTWQLAENERLRLKELKEMEEREELINSIKQTGKDFLGIF